VSSNLNKFKEIFSAKWVSIAVVAIAIAARIIQLVFFYNIRVDGMYQVMAMQNFTSGHGISLSKVLSSDLSATVYESLINWPPGYSVLLSPFYLLFNNNYILAGLALDILAAISLIVICRRILKLLETPIYLVNIFTLFTGFFIYYFYFISSSDSIAITFFAAAIYHTLLILKKDKPTLNNSAWLIILLFLAGFIKYLFIPIVFIIPLFLFLKGYGEPANLTGSQRAVLRKTGIISFLGLALLFSILLIYQKITSGSAAYISEPSRGWFPENLNMAWPSFPASLINPDTVDIVLPGTGLAVFRIFQILHLILFAGIFIFILRRIFKLGFKKLSESDSFFYINFFLSAGITILLTILSLGVGKEENIPGQWWTYIEEPRYYGLVNVLLHIAVFGIYQYHKMLQSKFLKYLMICLVIFMLPEFFRGIVFTANRITNITQEEYSWQNDLKIQKYADSIIEKEKKEYPVEKVVVTGSWYYVYYRVGIYSKIPALLETEKINDLSTLNSKKPTLVLIILQEKDFPDYLPFLSSKEKELAGSFRGFYFYTTYVNPH
jgi:hypothetical protein